MPRYIYPPGAHLISDSVGPRAGLDRRGGKVLALPGIEPRFLVHPAHGIVSELTNVSLAGYLLGLGTL
jgi:hypothetical protein